MSAPAPAASLVLACYNMTSQLRRTLLSLAPPHQHLDPGMTVQVIVVDNGSAPPPCLAELAVAGLDLELHHWPDPSPSPAAAMNFGLARARAPIVAGMIDGARMASPGLIAAGLRGCALHASAVVATYNYHLGPKAQTKSLHEGYDEAAEAALLAGIGWPADGYRLFEIAAPEIGEGWPGPLLESNALFMRRELWAELGGYDPAFVSPGGGAVNPDLLYRACALPGAQLIKIAGEATFHQIHGGTVSNAADSGTLRESARELARLRGRALTLLRAPGWVFDARTGRCERLPPVRAR